MDLRHSLTIRAVSFTAVSTYLARFEALQTGAAYSVADIHKVKEYVFKICGSASQNLSVNFLRMLLRALTLAFVFKQCCIKLSIRSSVTSRYLGA